MKRLILALMLAVCAFGVMAETPKLEPQELLLRVGEKKILSVTPTISLAFTTSPEKVVSVDAERMTVTGLKPGSVSLTGNASNNATSNLVKVTVVPADVKISELEKPLIQGETRTVTLPAAIGELNGPFTLRPATEDKFVTVAEDSKTVTANAVKGEQPVTLNVKSAEGVVVGTVGIKVLEAIQSISLDLPVSITEGTSKDLGVRLIGLQGTKFTPEQRSMSVTVENDKVLKIDAKTGTAQAQILEGNNDKEIAVILASNEGLNNKVVDQKFKAKVTLRLGSIVPPTPSSLPRDGKILITPTLRDREGNTLIIKQIDWSLKNAGNDKYVTLAKTDSSLMIAWKDAGKDEAQRPGFVEIGVTARSDKDRVITDTLIVQLLGEVAGFAPLKVRLNLMDDQTATDLYGKVTAREYFVTRVRLNNNLPAANDPKLQGASILAFSESVEVAVQYEKRRLTNGKHPRGEGKSVLGTEPVNPLDWQPVTANDLKDFEESPTDNPSNDMHVDPRCKGFITYRPYMFEMMVNSVDRRDERSTRSKVLRGLQAVGTLASVVTSVAVPGAQSDIPLGIEKYNSLFIPGFEKLWPTLRETNRQNLVSQTMKTIEEIPFGSDLARVLFFPKREFRGLLAGYETRVARICPYHFNIEVAVIQKKSAVSAVQ